MRAGRDSDLWVIAALSLLLILVVTFFASDVLRVVFGLPFLLFFPGYTVLSAVFPGTRGPERTEKLLLSCGISLGLGALTGLVLTWTAGGMRVYPVLLSLSIVTFFAVGVGIFRRRRLSADGRQLGPSSPRVSFWRSWGTRDRVVFGLLVVAVLAVIGSVAYVAVNPGKNERFTEFYVLGPDGTADGYPLELRVGEEATVILGIVNREHERAAYRVELAIDGERIDFTVDGGKRSAVEVELAHEEKWEEEVSFASRESGEDRKVEFILYKDGTAYFEAPLHLWVDVVD